MSSTTRTELAFYWMVTILVAIAFMVPGLGNLLHLPHFVTDMAHLGYPSYFMSMLGMWKVLGALAILLPGLRLAKEWAYAGMIFDLTSAAVSRLSVRDNPLLALIPVVLCFLVILSWKLRPVDRRI